MCLSLTFAVIQSPGEKKHERLEAFAIKLEKCICFLSLKGLGIHILFESIAENNNLHNMSRHSCLVLSNVQTSSGQKR